MNVTTITSKRQLTIPISVFEKTNLSIGDKVIVEQMDGGLVIKKALNLVNELGGSVSVPDRFKGANISKALKAAKKRHFGERE